MSDEVIICVENLGKRYSLRHQRGQRYVVLRDVIADKAKNLFRRNSDNGSRAGGSKELTSDLGPLLPQRGRTSGRSGT